jgi:23S rRNA C2498 (ribose-2'-O)-methylase RlmM
MYKASIKHILMTILAKELLVKHIEIHAFNRFDTDLLLSDEEFNRLLYFVEMNFNIDLSTQHITLHDRISDLVACIYQTTAFEGQFTLKSA